MQIRKTDLSNSRSSSLAHAQLSAVFWDRVMMMTVGSGSVVAMFIGFGMWFASTMGVLMVMESLRYALPIGFCL